MKFNEENKEEITLSSKLKQEDKERSLVMEIETSGQRRKRLKGEDSNDGDLKKLTSSVKLDWQQQEQTSGQGFLKKLKRKLSNDECLIGRGKGLLVQPKPQITLYDEWWITSGIYNIELMRQHLHTFNVYSQGHDQGHDQALLEGGSPHNQEKLLLALLIETLSSSRTLIIQQ